MSYTKFDYPSVRGEAQGPSDPPCPVCGHGGEGKVHTIREQHFGTGEPFRYLECAGCGCLSLLDPPADMTPHYPAEYYSFALQQPVRQSMLKRWLKAQRSDFVLGGRNLVGLLVTRPAHVPLHLRWLSGLGLSHRSRLLDVGCGSGALLLELEGLGFDRLTGADPFIACDLHYPHCDILRAELDALSGRYDIVMLHHSFEHMDRPREAMFKLAALLRPGGHALIRVPVADCAAWEIYGADWVQLDAPRHMLIPTQRGMRRLAEAAGLELVRVLHDSDAFQFWGSEQYRREIPLCSPRSHHRSPADSIFTDEQIEQWNREAALLNAQGRGDQAAFYLRRPL